MSNRFVLTAQLQLRAPTNTRQVVNQIKKQLQGVNVNLKLNVSPNAQSQIKGLSNQLNSVSKNAKQAKSQLEELGEESGKAFKRFFAFSIATSGFFKFSAAVKTGVAEAIAFERELIKVAQVSGLTTKQLGGLTREITRLSTTFGVSSAKILEVSRILTQSGLSANKTRIALEALTKSELAPTFDDIIKTTEGAIAVFRQFGVDATQLESKLGSINAVAGQFAVESGDIIAAVRRTGGAFQAAGGSLEELIALFTSVRATTRESAESIATGFRTIFTRIQRQSTADFLERLGIARLREGVEKEFVGPFEAIKRLSEGLQEVKPTSPIFTQVIEELGGFRQVSKVIPLIQQFGTSQRALKAAIEGQDSLAKDAALAQESLAVQIQKVREEFSALLRQFTKTDTFKTLVGLSLNLAKAFVSIAENIGPLLPALTALFAISAGRSAVPFFKGVNRQTFKLPIPGFNRGGLVPGSGNRDTVPASLTPGEFVIRKKAVEAIGVNNLAKLNNPQKFQDGNIVLTDDELLAANPFDLSSSQKSRRTALKKQRASEAESKRKQPTFGFAGLVPPGETIRNPGVTIDNKKVNIIRQGLAKGASSAVAVRLNRSILEGVKGAASNLSTRLGADRPTNSLVRDAIRIAGFEQAQGTLFEATLGSVGAPFNEKDTKNDGIDFPRGLGVASALFPAIPSNVPTDAKRNIKQGAEPARVASNIRNHIKRFELRSVPKFASGGSVTDTVPALLTPGEFVINRESAKRIGRGNLELLNNVQGFAKGGVVRRYEDGGNVNPFVTSSDPKALTFRREIALEFERLEKATKKEEAASKKSTKAKKAEATASNKAAAADRKQASASEDTTRASRGFGKGLLAFTALQTTLALPQAQEFVKNIGGARATGALQSLQGGVGAGFAAGATIGGPFGAVIGGLVGVGSALLSFKKNVREASLAVREEGIAEATDEFNDALKKATATGNKLDIAAANQAFINQLDKILDVDKSVLPGLGDFAAFLEPPSASPTDLGAGLLTVSRQQIEREDRALKDFQRKDKEARNKQAQELSFSGFKSSDAFNVAVERLTPELKTIISEEDREGGTSLEVAGKAILRLIEESEQFKLFFQKFKGAGEEAQKEFLKGLRDSAEIQSAYARSLSTNIAIINEQSKILREINDRSSNRFADRTIDTSILSGATVVPKLSRDLTIQAAGSARFSRAAAGLADPLARSQAIQANATANIVREIFADDSINDPQKIGAQFNNQIGKLKASDFGLSLDEFRDITNRLGLEFNDLTNTADEAATFLRGGAKAQDALTQKVQGELLSAVNLSAKRQEEYAKSLNESIKALEQQRLAAIASAAAVRAFDIDTRRRRDTRSGARTATGLDESAIRARVAAITGGPTDAVTISAGLAKRRADFEAGGRKDPVLASEISTLREALKLLGDASARTADYVTRLGEIERERAAAASAGKNFLFADRAERLKTARNVLAARSFLTSDDASAGGFGALDERRQQQIAKGLDTLGGIRLDSSNRDFAGRTGSFISGRIFGDLAAPGLGREARDIEGRIDAIRGDSRTALTGIADDDRTFATSSASLVGGMDSLKKSIDALTAAIDGSKDKPVKHEHTGTLTTEHRHTGIPEGMNGFERRMMDASASQARTIAGAAVQQAIPSANPAFAIEPLVAPSDADANPALAIPVQ